MAENVVQRKIPYFTLEVQKAFDALTAKEQLYAHHMACASWHGISACAKQLSVESPLLLHAFFDLFSKNSVDELSAAAVAAGVEPDDVEQVLEYFALLYSNTGNFLSFGDTKFVPSCSRATFETVINSAPVKTDKFTTELIALLYSLESHQKSLNYGCSAYYGHNVTKDEIAAVDDWMVQERMSQVNTRILKDEGTGLLNLTLAAAQQTQQGGEDNNKIYEHKGVKFIVTTGDHQAEMKGVVNSLQEASKYVANETQAQMLAAYIKHFDGGNVDDHKESQKFWVADKGPAVETNIGFIENYRDPAGTRAEWEGLVAVVNKHESAKYAQMVELAPQFIKLLPWGQDFENDSFSKPDFTALEVLTFASSGVPIGICIPNYDDIRKDFGFKNVYLSNVVGAMSFEEKINHITDEDWKLWPEKIADAFSVGVGVHELLGHGTGKLLAEDENGNLNFDKEKVMNPLLDGKPVDSWYKPGETWSSVFKAISNPYEETRAEAVALYLCLESEMLAIFNQKTEEDCYKTIHLVWLQMVRAGLVGLECYSTEKSQWLQAHMRARYCILQTLLRAPDPIVTIIHEGGELTITIDAKRIATDGKKAIGDLLVHLNVYKATADVKRGQAWFEELTKVDDKMLAMRETLMKVRKPRRQLVQPHTTLDQDGKVKLINFEGSVRGCIDAFVTRHKEIPLC